MEEYGYYVSNVPMNVHRLQVSLRFGGFELQRYDVHERGLFLRCLLLPSVYRRQI
jgi:hypothetical protein